VETATQAIRLVLSGVFDAHPNLKIILGHFGETLPFLVWRIDSSLNRPGQKAMSFRDVFCKNFYVTTSGFFSDPALICCMLEMGVDHILFAVDWPFVMNPPAVKWMENVSISDSDKVKILSGNAKRLLKMEPRPPAKLGCADSNRHRQAIAASPCYPASRNGVRACRCHNARGKAASGPVRSRIRALRREDGPRKLPA
jgi:hypothetical protein